MVLAEDGELEDDVDGVFVADVGEGADEEVDVADAASGGASAELFEHAVKMLASTSTTAAAARLGM